MFGIDAVLESLSFGYASNVIWRSVFSVSKVSDLLFLMMQLRLRLSSSENVVS